MTYDPADVHLLRNQDKAFCHERFHFVVFFKVDSFWVDMLFAHLESRSVDRLANLAFIAVNLEKFLPLFFILCYRCIQTLLFQWVYLCRKQTQLECIRIDR